MLARAAHKRMLHKLFLNASIQIKCQKPDAMNNYLEECEASKLIQKMSLEPVSGTVPQQAALGLYSGTKGNGSVQIE